MPNAESWHYFTLNDIADESAMYAKTPDEIVEAYTKRLSQAYLAPFAGQTSTQPSQIVQARRSKIVSKVRKDTVWLLVAANLLFALIPLGLAVRAFFTASRDVYQLRTRLNVTGVTAQLFEGVHAQKEVKQLSALFEENSKDASPASLKQVQVERLAAGGTEFVLLKNALGPWHSDGDFDLRAQP
jgi:hypothetical protein